MLLRFNDPHDPSLTWEFDRAFLESNWTCLWGRGCEGIRPEPAAEAGQGCCSVGAELLDEEEAMLISALAATLDPAHFEFAEVAAEHGPLVPPVSGDGRWHTRTVADSCIFSNRPGFSGGEGCALHVAAIRHGESPIDWKPSICWQLPLKIDRRTTASTTSTASATSTVARLRPWQVDDWQAGPGDRPCWTCTDPEAGERSGTGVSAYVGDEQVIDSLHDELDALLGSEVLVELRSRLGR